MGPRGGRTRLFVCRLLGVGEFEAILHLDERVNHANVWQV